MSVSKIYLDFEALNIKNIEKALTSLDNKASKIGLSKELQNQVNSLTNTVQKLKTELATVKSGKINDSNLKSFKTQVDSTLFELNNRISVLESSMSEISSSVNGDQVVTQINKIKNSIDETTVSTKNMIDAISNINGDGKVSIINTDELKEELRLINQINKESDNEGEYQTKSYKSIKSVTKALKDQSDVYESLQDKIYSLQDNNGGILKGKEGEYRKLQLELVKTIVLIKDLETRLYELNDNNEYDFKIGNFKFSSFSESIDEEFNLIKSEIKGRKNEIEGELSKVKLNVSNNKPETKNVVSNNNQSNNNKIDTNSNGRRQITIPLKLSEASEKSLWSKVQIAIDNIQTKASKTPIEVQIALVSGKKTQRNNELLEQLSNQINSISDGKIKPELTELMNNIQSQFDKQLKLEIGTNIKETTDSVKSGIKTMQRALKDAKLFIYPEIQIKDDSLKSIQSQIGNLLKNLVFNISNVQENIDKNKSSKSKKSNNIDIEKTKKQLDDIIVDFSSKIKNIINNSIVIDNSVKNDILSSLELIGNSINSIFSTDQIKNWSNVFISEINSMKNAIQSSGLDNSLNVIANKNNNINKDSDKKQRSNVDKEYNSYSDKDIVFETNAIADENEILEKNKLLKKEIKSISATKKNNYSDNDYQLLSQTFSVLVKIRDTIKEVGNNNDSLSIKKINNATSELGNLAKDLGVNIKDININAHTTNKEIQEICKNLLQIQGSNVGYSDDMITFETNAITKGNKELIDSELKYQSEKVKTIQLTKEQLLFAKKLNDEGIIKTRKNDGYPYKRDMDKFNSQWIRHNLSNKNENNLYNNIKNYKGTISKKNNIPNVKSAKSLSCNGSDIINSYKQGILDRKKDVQKAVEDVVESGIYAAKKAQDSNSPSEKYRKLGNDAIDGYILGITEKKDELIKSIDGIINQGLNNIAKDNSNIDNIIKPLNSLNKTLKNTSKISETDIDSIISNFNKLSKGLNSISIDNSFLSQIDNIISNSKDLKSIISSIDKSSKQIDNINNKTKNKQEIKDSKSNNSAANLYSNLVKNASKYYDLLIKFNNGSINNKELAELKKIKTEWDLAKESKDRYAKSYNGDESSINKYNESKSIFEQNHLLDYVNNYTSKISADLEKKSNVNSQRGFKYIPEYYENLEKLEYKIKELNSLPIIDDSQDTINNISKLKNEIDDLHDYIKKAFKSEEFKIVDPETVRNTMANIEKIIRESSAMPKKLKREFNELNLAYENLLSSNAPASQVKELDNRLAELKYELQKTGKVGKSTFASISQRLKDMNAKFIAYYFSFQDFIRYGREAVTVVKELDTALTEMNKVSNESIDTLKQYQKASFDIAGKIGTTAKDLDNATADWMRLGESLSEAAESAKQSTILLNVSEFEGIEEATESLTAMSQAFKDINKSEIVDVMNEIGNNYSISTDELATALKDGAATLSTQGNNLYEAAALVTAGNAVTQDATKTGTGLRTISLRIAGTEEAKEELAELEEDVEDYVVMTASKKQQIIKDYTAVASNNGKGVDILDSNGNYKNTYQILKEISKVYAEIQQEDKQYGTNRAQALVEELAGKNRSNIAASILQNPEMLENAYESALNAAGSATDELNKYLDSIEGRLSKFQNQGQELIYKVFNSDLVKGFISTGTGALSILDKLIDSLGTIPTLLTAIAGGMSAIKNKGKRKMPPFHIICPWLYVSYGYIGFCITPYEIHMGKSQICLKLGTLLLLSYFGNLIGIVTM